MSERAVMCTQYELFLQKLKSKQSKNKQERKNNLRQIHTKKLVQSSEGSNEQQLYKKTYKRGNKWWNKINRYYFQSIDETYLDNMRMFTMSDDFLEFGGELASLLPYYQEIICGLESDIFQDDTIRVLYQINKGQNQEKHILVGYLCSGENVPRPSEGVVEQNDEEESELPKFYSFHLLSETDGQQAENNECSASNLPVFYPVSDSSSDQLIKKCLLYEKIMRNEERTQVQNEIQIWQLELESVYEKNMCLWETVKQQMFREMCLFPNLGDLSKQIEKAKKLLIRSQTFAYFRMGYADKTIDQYEKALGYINPELSQSNQNQVSVGFETDCKICFCTKNEPNNRVVYCDSCNTSFHQSCYGILELQENRGIECDVCIYKKQNQNVQKDDVLSCQICYRGKYPMRLIDGHFYHVACLILFDYGYIDEYKLVLKDKGHLQIMEKVIDNEVLHGGCQFCVKNDKLGMQFICTEIGCEKSFHPICGYLNGCIFNIRRIGDGGINVEAKCRSHAGKGPDEAASQVYLRRFMCNYKNTTSMKEDEFKAVYKKELEKMATIGEKVGGLDEEAYGIRKIFKVRVPLGESRNKVELKKSVSAGSMVSNNSSGKNIKQSGKKGKQVRDSDRKDEEQ